MIRIAVGVLLAASTVCVWSKEPVRTEAELATTHGFVRVTLPQVQLQGAIALRLPKAKKPVTLTSMPQDGRYAFGAWLPAGEYDIDGMQAIDGSRYAPVVVKAGTLTDLGALVQVSLGGYEYVPLPIQHRDADEEARSAFEHRAELLRAEDPIRWRPAAPPKPWGVGPQDTDLGLVADLLLAYEHKVNKPRLSKRLKSSPTIDEMWQLARLAAAPRNEESAADSAGNLYYGAELGQLRVRHVDGSWDVVDTGALDEISAVEVNGNQLVAGTLSGKLLTSTDRGASWKQSFVLQDGELAADIDRVGGRWVVLALKVGPPLAPAGVGAPRPWGMAGKTVRVLAATQDDLGDLAPIGEFPLGETIWFMHFRGASDVVTGQAAGNDYWVNTAADLHRLDLATWQWSMAKRPEHRVDSFRISPDGSLITVKRLQGAFSKVSVSGDRGASWQPYSRPPYTLYDVVLDTKDSGVSTRWNADSFSASIEFYGYDPKVKDWRKTHETPKGCVQLLRDAAYRQRFCLTTGGSIFDYRENTWIVEFALD